MSDIRIKDLPESISIDNGDYIAIDNESTGTRKYPISDVVSKSEQAKNSADQAKTIAEQAADSSSEAVFTSGEAKSIAENALEVAETVSQTAIDSAGAEAGQVPTANGNDGWSWTSPSIEALYDSDDDSVEIIHGLRANPEATFVNNIFKMVDVHVMNELGYVSPKMCGAKGDGVTDDTLAWNSFSASTDKVRFIPKGSYLVDNKIKKFNKDVLGGDNFDLVNRWTKTPLASKDAPVQMYDELDIANDLPDGWTQSFASWILQKHMTGDRDLPPSNMFPVGQHIDLVLDGNFTHAYEPGSAGGNNSPNYTGMVVTANNRMSGNIGVTGVTARLKDLSETDNPNQLVNGVTKMGAFYAEVRRNTRYNTVNKNIGVGGSYGFGMETYVYWDSDEDEIYEAQENFGDYKSWMCGYHCTSASNNLPITAGILIDRTSGANSGFYNGIIIGGMSMKVGDNAQGAPGTIGLNFASWRSSAYGETAIKYGYAHRHHWYKNIAKISAPSVRMANENGVFVLGLGSEGSNPSGIQFFGGADYDNIQETDSGITTYGSIRVDEQAFFSLATTKFRWAVQNGTVIGHLDLSATALAPIEHQNLGLPGYHWNNAYIDTLTIGSTELSEANLKKMLALIN